MQEIAFAHLTHLDRTLEFPTNCRLGYRAEDVLRQRSHDSTIDGMTTRVEVRQGCATEAAKEVRAILIVDRSWSPPLRQCFFDGGTFDQGPVAEWSGSKGMLER